MSDKKVSILTLMTAVAASSIASFWISSIFRKTSNKKESKVTREKVTYYDETLITEQLARNYAFFGEEGMKSIREKFVIVVGAGGVGSWTVTMLVRSGIRKIRVIDFDQVTLSSLNRHAVADLSDVGTPKVQTLKNHLSKVAPWCEIEPVIELLQLKGIETLLGGNPDYVVDCIDNIDTKVDLLYYCHQNNIPVISSMGASCKSDPTRINVGDISVSIEDGLSRAVRRRLKLKGITTGIPVVFSSEKPGPDKAKLLPLPDEEYEKGNVQELGVLQDFRVRILPVLGTMPGMFGLTIATHILTTMAGYPTEYIEGKKRIKIWDSILQSLAGQKARLGEKSHKLPIDLNDVCYLVEEVFRGKSPISKQSTRLSLTKWRPDAGISLQNLVVVTKDEQKIHEQLVLKEGKPLHEVYSQDILDLVEKRFREEREYSKWRE